MTKAPHSNKQQKRHQAMKANSKTQTRNHPLAQSKQNGWTTNGILHASKQSNKQKHMPHTWSQTTHHVNE